MDPWLGFGQERLDNKSNCDKIGCDLLAILIPNLKNVLLFWLRVSGLGV